MKNGQITLQDSISDVFVVFSFRIAGMVELADT